MSTNPKPSQAELDDVIDELVAIRAEFGTIRRYQYEAAERACGRSIGHLRRCVGQRLPAETQPSITITEDLKIELARTGNLKDYVMNVLAPEDKTTATYQRVLRALRRDAHPQEGQALMGGMQAWREATLFSSFTAQCRNERWQFDIQKLNTLVYPDRSTNPVRPYFICAIDDYSRKIVLWDIVAMPAYYNDKNRLVMPAVKGEQVAQALLNATVRNGVPEQILIDNGREFTAECVHSAASILDTCLKPVTRYRGDNKGYVEAAFRSLEKRIVAHDPARTGGKGSSLRFTIDGMDASRARDIATLRRDVGRVVDDYNNRTHRSLFDPDDPRIHYTPQQKWDMSDTELLMPDDTQVRAATKHIAPLYVYGSKVERELTNRGLEIRKVFYTALGSDERDQIAHSDKLTRNIRRVTARPVGYDPAVPDRPDRVAVYDHHDKFLFMAVRSDLVDEEHALDVKARQEAILARAERLQARGHDRNVDDFDHGYTIEPDDF